MIFLMLARYWSVKDAPKTGFVVIELSEVSATCTTCHRAGALATEADTVISTNGWVIALLQFQNILHYLPLSIHPLIQPEMPIGLEPQALKRLRAL